MTAQMMVGISRAIHNRAWDEARELLTAAGVSLQAAEAFLVFEQESAELLPER